MTLPVSPSSISFSQLACELGNTCTNISLRSYSQCAALSSPDAISELYGKTCTIVYGTGTWSSGGAMLVCRNYYGTTGTQNSGLIFGGYRSGNFWCTEEYNGTSWASGPSYSTYASAGAGTQNSAVAFGGVAPGDGQPLSRTQEYDGSVWSATNCMNRNAGYVGGNGTQNAAIAIGGYLTAYNATSCTELYNGSTWSTGTAVDTVMPYPGSAGITNSTVAFTSNLTREYNGSTWSSSNSLINPREPLGAGTQNDALGSSSAASWSDPLKGCNESYNGSNWSTENSLLVARGATGKGGNNSANSTFVAGGVTSDSYANTVSCTEEFTRPSCIRLC